MRSCFTLAWLLSAILLTSTVSVNAQQPTAALTGVVVDSNGAVIPGATVIATNKGTNASRTASTNDEGVYSIPNLPVGVYSLEVRSQNFQTRMFDEIILNAGQSVTSNVTLHPEGVSVQIDEYFGTNPLVDTQDSNVDSVISDREIEHLPLNGRNFLELLFSHRETRRLLISIRQRRERSSYPRPVSSDAAATS